MLARRKGRLIVTLYYNIVIARSSTPEDVEPAAFNTNPTEARLVDHLTVVEAFHDSHKLKRTRRLADPVRAPMAADFLHLCAE